MIRKRYRETVSYNVKYLGDVIKSLIQVPLTNDEVEFLNNAPKEYAKYLKFYRQNYSSQDSTAREKAHKASGKAGEIFNKCIETVFGYLSISRWNYLGSEILRIMSETLDRAVHGNGEVSASNAYTLDLVGRDIREKGYILDTRREMKPGDLYEQKKRNLIYNKILKECSR